MQRITPHMRFETMIHEQFGICRPVVFCLFLVFRKVFQGVPTQFLSKSVHWGYDFSNIEHLKRNPASGRVATPRYLACLITPSETGDRADQRCEFGTFWNVFEKIYTFPGSRKFTHRFPRSRKFTPTESKCSKIMIFACQLQFGISSLLRGVIS